MNIPDAGDAEEANEVYNFIQTLLNNLPEKGESFSSNVQPGVYSSGIIIYNMSSEIDQNKLIVSLKAEKIKKNWKKIEVSFYEKEILNRVGDTTTRGKEKLLRSEILR